MNTAAPEPLHVLVLAGGPDREREVSLRSGAAVAAALRDAGHRVEEADVGPDAMEAVDAFEAADGTVIFPVLHGPWGEGGELQGLLDERGIPYVGSSAPVARLCMNKHLSKLALEARGIPTPAFELLVPGESIRLEPPVVLKPVDEGSSIDIHIARTPEVLERARAALFHRHERVLVERCIEGPELTVSLLGRSDFELPEVLPPIRIKPSAGFYDYRAKYERDDTRYHFETGLSPETLEQAKRTALETYRALGCRHLARIDLMVDGAGTPWVLEANTMPGFTDHSLLPMAARRAGLAMPALTDRLVRLAA